VIRTVGVRIIAAELYLDSSRCHIGTQHNSTPKKMAKKKNADKLERRLSVQIHSRLDDIRTGSWNTFRLEQQRQKQRRKQQESFLDSKAELEYKHKLWKQLDAIYDACWIRMVWINESKFLGALVRSSDPSSAAPKRLSLSPAHSTLLRVSTIQLEFQQALLDGLDQLLKIQVALHGRSWKELHSTELIPNLIKSDGLLVILQQILEDLHELYAEIHMQLSTWKQDSIAKTWKREAFEALQRQPSLPPSTSPRMGLDETEDNDYVLPAILETPLRLLSERLSLCSPEEMEEFYSIAPDLRDVPNNIEILSRLGCDSTKIGLGIADSIWRGLFRALGHPSLAFRDAFVRPLREAFQSMRAVVWTLLKNDHEIDLMQTIATPPFLPKKKNSKTGVTAAPSPNSTSDYSSASSENTPPPAPYTLRPHEAGSPSSSSSSSSSSSVAAASPPSVFSPPPPLLSHMQHPVAHVGEQAHLDKLVEGDEDVDEEMEHMEMLSVQSNPNPNPPPPPAPAAAAAAGNHPPSLNQTPSTSTANATSKSCAHADCKQPRYKGKPYCLTHMQQ